MATGKRTPECGTTEQVYGYERGQRVERTMDEIFGDVISSYTRAQAIEDGMLVDVSTTAREAGLCFPVALTRAVWELCVTVPPKAQAQDEAGRLWDVLSMLRFAIIRKHSSVAQRLRGEDLRYSLIVHTAKGRRRLILKSVCGPGDDAEPVITIMLPEED